ncbi:vesicle transport v-SNARE 11, partial [Tanacetum coccineum]
ALKGRVEAGRGLIRKLWRIIPKAIMRKMELEAKSMTNDGKAKVVLKLGAYGNDVKKLKNELENFVQVVLFKLWGILINGED